MQGFLNVELQFLLIISPRISFEIACLTPPMETYSITTNSKYTIIGQISFSVTYMLGYAPLPILIRSTLGVEESC